LGGLYDYSSHRVLKAPPFDCFPKDSFPIREGPTPPAFHQFGAAPPFPLKLSFFRLSCFFDYRFFIRPFTHLVVAKGHPVLVLVSPFRCTFFFFIIRNFRSCCSPFFVRVLVLRFFLLVFFSKLLFCFFLFIVFLSVNFKRAPPPHPPPPPPPRPPPPVKIHWSASLFDSLRSPLLATSFAPGSPETALNPRRSKLGA